MAIKVTTSNDVKSVPTYPRIVEHIPTGILILLISEFKGLLLRPNQHTKSAVGALWNIGSESNYRDYNGPVTLQNEED